MAVQLRCRQREGIFGPGLADELQQPALQAMIAPDNHPGSAFRRGDNRVAPEVCQSVSGRVRGSPKRVMTLVLKLVMAVMWSPEVVMTRRQ